MGIIVLQHSIDPTRVVLLKERCAELRKGTSAVLLQSGLDERWWADSVDCYCYLRNVQDLLNGDLESHSKVRSFKGPVKASPVWKERCYLEHSSDTHWLREEFGRNGSHTLEGSMQKQC